MRSKYLAAILIVLSCLCGTINAKDSIRMAASYELREGIEGSNLAAILVGFSYVLYPIAPPVALVFGGACSILSAVYALHGVQASVRKFAFQHE